MSRDATPRLPFEFGDEHLPEPSPLRKPPAQRDGTRAITNREIDKVTEGRRQNDLSLHFDVLIEPSPWHPSSGCGELEYLGDSSKNSDTKGASFQPTQAKNSHTSAHGVTLPSVEFEGGRPFAVVAASENAIDAQLKVNTDVCPDELPRTTCWRDSDGTIKQRFELPGSVRGNSALSCSETEEQTLTIQCQSAPATSVTVTLRGQLPRKSRVAYGTDETDDVGSRSSLSPYAETPESDGLGPSGKRRSLDDAPINADRLSSPRFVVDSVDDAELSGTSLWRQASEHVEQLIDQHINFVHRVFDTCPANAAPTTRWQGELGGVCLRLFSETVDQWQASAGSGEPLMALIVKLARELPDVLSSVCRRPRHVLRRERQPQSLGRVREVDSGCLRWLARQPGASVAEKAGARQRVLAIVRVESIDTLENRLVRDLLNRALHACRRYRLEHRSVASHARVRDVQAFQQLVQRLLKESSIASASELVASPQPNYVLQFDSRYRILWDAWQQLVRQQQLEDNVWRWRNRLFAEHVQLAVMSALHGLSNKSATHGGDVFLQREQNAGQFIDPRTACGPVVLEHTSDYVDPVRGDQCHRHPLIPSSMPACGPDLILVRRSSSGRSSQATALGAIWSLLDFDLTLNTTVSSLPKAAPNEDAGSVSPLERTLLVQPMLNGQALRRLSDSKLLHSTQSAVLTQVNDERRLRVTLPLQQHMNLISEQVAWALRLT